MLGTGKLTERLNLLKVSQWDNERFSVRLKDILFCPAFRLQTSTAFHSSCLLFIMCFYFLKTYRIEALNVKLHVFPLQTGVTKSDSDLAQLQTPRTSPGPCELWWSFPQICPLAVFSVPCWPAAPELGHWLFLKISPSRWACMLLASTGVFLYTALTSAASCMLPVPGAKSTQAAVLPIACFQEHTVRGKISRQHCSCRRHFTYLSHNPHHPGPCSRSLLLP